MIFLLNVYKGFGSKNLESSLASVQEVFGLEQGPFGDVKKGQGILSEFCTNWSRSRNGSNAQTLVRYLLEQPCNVWHNEDAT